MKPARPVDKAAGRIGRKLKVLYERVDLTVDDVKRQISTTCEEGCDHCCHLAPSMSIPEGLAILDLLSRDPHRWWWFQQKIKKLREWVEILENPETTYESWFDRQIPCLFLKDRRCTIYKVRPVICRSHLSVDDPLKCNPPADSETALRTVNLEVIDKFVWKEVKRYTDREKLPLGVAPLPAVMLWAYLYWTRGKRGFKEAIEGSALAAGYQANGVHWLHLSRDNPRYKDAIEQFYARASNNLKPLEISDGEERTRESKT